MALGGLVIAASWWVAGRLDVANSFLSSRRRNASAHVPVELPTSQWAPPAAAFGQSAA
jgi:hypothetical protein